MSKKYTKAKRVVIPMLTMLVLMLQLSTAAFAMSNRDVSQLARNNTQVEVVATSTTANNPTERILTDRAVFGTAGTTADSRTPANYPTFPNHTKAVYAPDTRMAEFKDWTKADGGWWFGKDSVKYAVGMGYIQGTDQQKLDGNSDVSTTQFAVILSRMLLTDTQRTAYITEQRNSWIADQQEHDKLANNTPRTVEALGAMYDSNKMVGTPDGEHIRAWYAEELYMAEQSGITKGVTFSPSSQTGCPRGTMAVMLVNAMNIRKENTAQIDTSAAIRQMVDSLELIRSGQSEEIGLAIGSGLIAGVGGNKFDLQGTMNRASLCEVLLRLDNPNNERLAILKQVAENPSTIPGPAAPAEGNNQFDKVAPITIDNREPTVKHRAPREGDTVIRPDGTSVVLARDPVTKILGYKQNVGAWLGTASVYNDRYVDIHAFAGGTKDFGAEPDRLVGGGYQHSPFKGEENTYHWDDEWNTIRDTTYPGDKVGKNGELDATGYWVYSIIGDGCDSWIWQGPSA